MPNLFLKIEQIVDLDPGSELNKSKVQSKIDKSEKDFELNCKFFLVGSQSSCGFQIQQSDFIEGGFSITTKDSATFSVAISGVAKVKVYEMQMTAYSENRSLCLTSVSILGTSVAMSLITKNLDPGQTVKYDGEKEVLLKCQIGTKKSALLAYQ